jgi:hypothetical protein
MISGLGCHCHNHLSGEAGEATAEGVLEEASGVPNAAPSPGAAGQPDHCFLSAAAHLQGTKGSEAALA